MGGFLRPPPRFFFLIKVVAGSLYLPGSTKSLESLLKFVIYDVGIYLSGGDLRMSQGFLGQAQILGFA